MMGTGQANTKGKKRKGGQEEKREGRCGRFTLGSARRGPPKDAEAPSRTRRRAGLVDDREAHVARRALDHAHRRLDLDRVGVGQLLLGDLLDLRARHLADLLGVGLAAARRDACFRRGKGGRRGEGEMSGWFVDCGKEKAGAAAELQRAATHTQRASAHSRSQPPATAAAVAEGRQTHPPPSSAAPPPAAS